jgi:hypothetical protein
MVITELAKWNSRVTTLPDFKLETHFSKWEFKARHHMTASDAESISMRDLLALATPEEREEFEGLWLGNTPIDRFRIGLGRSGLDHGLAAFDAHLMRNRR